VRIFAARLVVVCLVLAGPSAAVRAQETTPVKLLAAINRASGAPYRYHIRSVEQPLLPDRAHQTSDVSETYQDEQGAEYVRERCERDICSGFYFDGNLGYGVDANQTALPISPKIGAFEVTLRAIESYAFTDPDFVARGGRVTERPVGSHDDGLIHLIVTAAGAIPMDVGIDRQTMLVRSAANFQTSGPSVVGFHFVFADERPVAGGVVLPFEIGYADDRLDRRFAQRTIIKEPFEPPAGLAPRFSSGAATIKMESSRAGAPPVALCTIGGVTVECLLDTGNSGLSMSLELAEQLKLEPVSVPFQVHGIGSYATGLVNAPALEIGRANFPPAKYVVLHDLGRFGYDLVLGADFFAHAHVTIDYPRRTITLAAESAPKDDADAIPIRFLNFVPVVAVQLTGLDAHLALDTGDESAINLGESYYKAHPGLFKPTGAAYVGGVGGQSEEITGEIASMQIGSRTLEHQRIGVTKRLAPTADGHLGSAFFSRFAIVFDYAHERVKLIPVTGRP
jgi:hypothetical protein